MPGGFRVVSANGRVVAYIYVRDDLVRFGRDLSTAEALAIAKAIAALPEAYESQAHTTNPHPAPRSTDASSA
jgi:hypothetical protein